jgi:hypothetical protein
MSTLIDESATRSVSSSVGRQARCIYSEAINLHELGRLSIQRASHVEPTAEGHWQADLSTMSGPLLGPFARRTDALVAEHAWLVANWLLRRD